MTTKKKIYTRKHNKTTMRNGYIPKKSNTYEESVMKDNAFGKTKRNMTARGITDRKEWSKEFNKNLREEKTKLFLKDAIQRKKYVPKLKFIHHQNPKKSKISRKRVKYKSTILDYIAESKSRDVIYIATNEISKGIMYLFKKTDLSNNAINFLRSGLTFLLSETISKMLEKELSFIDKTELFFNIGKTVYKVIVNINKKEGKYHVEYRYKKATVLDATSYNHFKRNRNREIDKFFNYDLSLISLINRKVNNQYYILFIIKYGEKFALINKENKNQFITTKCQKENFDIENAYKYLSNEFNIDSIKFVKLENYIERDKDVLNEYLVVYTDINNLSNNKIIIDDINENMIDNHKKIYNNYKDKIEKIAE